MREQRREKEREEKGGRGGLNVGNLEETRKAQRARYNNLHAITRETYNV